MTLRNTSKLTEENLVLLGSGRNSAVARVGDISSISVEVNMLTVRVNGRERPLLTYGSLARCAKRLPNSFFRVGRNCIVNLAAVAKTDMTYRNSSLTMKDGSVIEVSRNQTIAFRRQLSI